MRKPSRGFLLALTLVASALAAGQFIHASHPQTQPVRGVLLVDGEPMATTKVYVGKGSDCSGATPVAVTATDGTFAFDRQVSVGTFAVVVQSDVVCVDSPEGWRRGWHSVYGPAPNALSIHCNRASDSTWACSVTGTYPDAEREIDAVAMTPVR